MPKRVSESRRITRWAGILLMLGAIILFGRDVARSTAAASPQFLTVSDIHRFGVTTLDGFWVWALTLMLGALLAAMAGRVRRERRIFRR